jgi:DNA-binding IclR family transcriptional regulator
MAARTRAAGLSPVPAVAPGDVNWPVVSRAPERSLARMTQDEFPAAAEYGTAPQYPIDSVDNALRVILLLGSRESLRLTDVSQYLGVASSTAHRLLAMLQFRGFVRQDGPSRSYVPGPMLDDLAFAMLRRLDVRNRAHPVLEKLSADTQETVHLGRLEGTEVHFIDSIESTRALRVGNRLGRTMPAHCTSTGKALLSTLTDAEVMALYPEERLVQLTPKSVGTRTELLAALERIRAEGFASSSEESEEGVSSIAIALHPSRAARFAVNVSVPASRLSARVRRDLLDRLREAAEELEQLQLW